MAISFVDNAVNIWRSFNTIGVPASGKYRPKKTEIVVWGGEVETQLTNTEGRLTTAEANIVIVAGDIAAIASGLPWDVAEGGTGATTAAGARVALDLEIGVDVQAFAANLGSLAGLTLAANKGLYSTAANTLALYDISADGRTWNGLTGATAQRAALGLGTIATTDLIDEDSFSTNSASRAPSQQSTKAYISSYVGTQIAAIPASVNGWEFVSKFYDFAIDGLVTTITTPDFADGYEYQIIGDRFDHDQGTSRSLTVSQYLETNAGYGSAIVSGTIGISNDDTSIILTIIAPRSIGTRHFIKSLFSVTTVDSSSDTESILTEYNSTAQKILRVRIALSASGNFSAGTLNLYRRQRT